MGGESRPHQPRRRRADLFRVVPAGDPEAVDVAVHKRLAADQPLAPRVLRILADAEGVGGQPRRPLVIGGESGELARHQRQPVDRASFTSPRVPEGVIAQPSEPQFSSSQVVIWVCRWP